MSDDNDRVEGNINPSNEIFQPALRRRRRQVISPTQPADHDYVEAELPQELPPTQRRESVDISPSEEDEAEGENGDGLEYDALEEEEEADELLSNGTGSSRSNSDHDYAESPPEPLAIDRDQPNDEDIEENLPIQMDANTNPSILANAAAAPIPLDVEAGTSAAASVAALAPDAVTDLTSPSPQPKKRKRLWAGRDSGTSKATTADNPAGDDDKDDGHTCPICFDHWEMSGNHRLVSLRCGHLFGDSCIRRWLDESMKQTSVRTCPQCKSKAANRDIRFLYAKRLQVFDRTVEYRIREELDSEKKKSEMLRTELSTCRMSLAVETNKISKLEEDNKRLRDIVRVGNTHGVFKLGRRSSVDNKILPSFKMYLEQNVDLFKGGGSRVLVYSTQQSTLIASQCSAQQLFPGYGVRFIEMSMFRPLNFLHTSGKLVRDICLSADEQLLGVASMEKSSKLFDLRTRQSTAVFSCGGKPIWSCAMDRNERENLLYLGDQCGSYWIYDVRYPDKVVNEFSHCGDITPVINMAPVQANKSFPNGGILVCKLMSFWFYEYRDGTAAIPTRLNIEGPFLSMNFNAEQETVLVSTRSNKAFSQSRFILGKIEKLDDLTVFDVKVTFFGSKPTPVMARAAQIPVESNTLVVGYLQDIGHLAVYDVRRRERSQATPVHECVNDICAIQTVDRTLVAALTDYKCRIYKVHSSIRTYDSP